MGWTTIITYCIYHIHKDVRTYAYIYNTTYLITFHKHTPHESPPVSPKSHQGETPENAKTEPTKPGWSFPTIGFFFRVVENDPDHLPELRPGASDLDDFVDFEVGFISGWKNRRWLPLKNAISGSWLPVWKTWKTRVFVNFGAWGIFCWFVAWGPPNTSRCLGGPEYLLFSSGF